ncbi:putative 2-aminoethylphosphonate ABC transporter permease subunit [Leisingera sp. McT4-56]|uniref:putative 2-aminoethylphosphonate ABC transporter permease subunit n=1 Tax=Leisingera sp. McT4-56 TaxID=2881255 RepID=UPI001CF8AD2C|nr:putative 2-aminoethylphosphonate ABC transporter permease subunit [Leisingera sp. McT4-56]MCB4457994.1 putative 2-aminoethylphosphonate ABC transporter permease subunit [Leisingera sp. McT4-56]
MTDAAHPLPKTSVKARMSRDDLVIRGGIVAIFLYLLVALVFPMGAMLAKAFSTYAFQLEQYEFQVSDEAGTFDDTVHTAAVLNAANETLPQEKLTAKSTSSISATAFFPEFSFRSPELYRIRTASEDAAFLKGAQLHSGPEWVEMSSNEFRQVLLKPSRSYGFGNFTTYFSTPVLFKSIRNSLLISVISTAVTVSLAFAFAYALHRSCMAFKGTFRLAAMAPILVPSLLPGIALVYLFGNQGMLKWMLMGETIYGPIGILLGSVFFSFPHAFIIIATALTLSDARLYEAAASLRSSPFKTFMTVTLPGARFGLISASFVVFSLVMTDFGLPKVIGGQYSMLAVDIYQQVIGQQNFEMGAVVSFLLIIPALMAFTVDRLVQGKQQSLLSARSVPYEPAPRPLTDKLCFAFCAAMCVFLLGIIGVCQYAALVKFYPYDLSLSLSNYRFDLLDGGWASYFNSIKLALLSAVFGTAVVFLAAYFVEKGNAFSAGRGLLQGIAMLPMAIPGMVLGLAYIFFFNDAANPFHWLYGTMAILVVSTVTHFFTVAYLTSATALKQVDAEFEPVAASLKQPVFRLFSTVTVPMCAPALLEIGIYLFVNAMTTVSVVVFLYSHNTPLASIAILNMDDAGDIAPAAAMGMMIFYTNLAARLFHLWVSRVVLKRSQAWRTR